MENLKTGPGPMTEEQEFARAVRPLIDYLNEKHHPHVSVIVTNKSAELVEGLRYLPFPIEHSHPKG